MLCSISTSKSNSNWLDRLRSSRGFKTDSDSDLDNFISQQTLSLSSSENEVAHVTEKALIITESAYQSSVPKRLNHILDSTEDSCENDEKDWFGLLNNVLADLFMTKSRSAISTICSKKSSRKQGNPRYCAPLNSPVINERCLDALIRRDERLFATTLSDGDNCLAGGKCRNGDVNITEQDVGCTDDIQGDTFYSDMKGFSRTDVTVIDTSCPSWKVEKVVFRKKNEWKIREKKCQWKNLVRKKRGVSSLDETVRLGKKPKVAILPLTMSKESQRHKPRYPSHEWSRKTSKMVELRNNIDAYVSKKGP